jgi:putative peptidoglycan lipid II flippase
VSTETSAIRSSANMAVGTIVSRITGVLRNITMTAAIGYGLVSDAFSLGNTLPNIVYILLIGGALNAVFVPQLVRKMKDDPDDGAAYADRLLTLVASALLVITAVAIMFAPWIIRLYSTRDYDPAQAKLATDFARYCLPQIFFYGVYTMVSQVLNARGKFGAPMYAPILNNIVGIGVFMAFITTVGTSTAHGTTLTHGQIAWLGIGTTAGVAAQALILLPIMVHSGYIWHPRFDWRGVGLGKAGRLALWTMGLVAANQVGYIVITRLATLANVIASQNGLTDAGLTTYQNAHLVFVLPHSIITVSLVTVMLPALSRTAHSGQLSEVGREISTTIRTIAALMLPIGVMMVPLSPTLTMLMFGWGAAGRAAALYTGYVVAALALGLIPFTLYYVLLRGWYALEDTRTPFFMAILLNAVNVLLAIGLFFMAPNSVKMIALGLAYSLAYWVSLLVAWQVFSRRVGGLDTYRTVRSLVRMAVASVLAGLVSLGVMLLIQSATPEGPLSSVLILAASGLAGLGTYLALARLMRIQEVAEVISLLKSRGRTA